MPTQPLAPSYAGNATVGSKPHASDQAATPGRSLKQQAASDRARAAGAENLPQQVSVKATASQSSAEQKLSWQLSDFDIGKPLGKGKFGNVYLAREKRTQYVVALKVRPWVQPCTVACMGSSQILHPCHLQVLFKSQLQQSNVEHQLRREVEIQAHLRHPNILRLYGYFYDAVSMVAAVQRHAVLRGGNLIVSVHCYPAMQDKIYLILEFAAKGELYRELQKHGRFNEQQTAT